MSTFIANTPEAQAARIQRVDSLDFATTCCGVSPASGTPCRKGIPSNPGQKSSGIVTRYEGREYFFCAAHKDQAKDMALKHSKTFNEKRKRMGRSSIDTLVEKVEVITGNILGEGGRPVSVVAQTTTSTDPNVGTMQYTEFTTQGLPQNSGHNYMKPTYKPPQRIDDDSGHRRGILSLLCCCITVPMSIRKKHKKHKKHQAMQTIEEEPIARPTHVQFNNGTLPPPFPNMNPNPPRPGPGVLSNGGGKQGTAQQMFSNAVSGDSVTSYKNRPTGNTIYIPPTLSDDTTAKLLRELRKPFSESDEPGYIYVFLLTDKPLSATPTATAGANPSGYLQRAARHAPDAAPSKLMLKIGRAENVQRRMHQWQNQCDYNLSLMRFYPYTPSSEMPRKVPNCNRVERLIHIELQDCNKIIDCSRCGKTHKEWFEIEATKEGLRSVDDTIKRWIKYAEDTSGKKGQAAVKIPDMPHIKGSGNGSRPPAAHSSSNTAFAAPSAGISGKKPNSSNNTTSSPPKKPAQPSTPPRKPTAASSTPQKKPASASPQTSTLKPDASSNSRPNSRRPSPARPSKTTNNSGNSGRRRYDSDIDYDEDSSDGEYHPEVDSEVTIKPSNAHLMPHASNGRPSARDRSPARAPNSQKPSPARNPARPAKKTNNSGGSTRPKRRDNDDIIDDEDSSDGTYEWESGEEDTATGKKGQKRRIPKRAVASGRNWMGVN